MIKNGEYVVKADKMQFHIQEFIEGKTLEVNTAPDCFLEQSAQTLGKIHNALKGYKRMKISFGEDFFNVSNVIDKKQSLLSLLDSEETKKDELMAFEIKEQIKHAEKISGFNIDTSKLTYSNSHGDYYISQIITHDKEFTVIDWTSACCLPICNEIIMSYAFADPACKNGTIDIHKFKQYIDQYLYYNKLSEYDLKIMPYLFYWHLFLTNYTPPFSLVPVSYKLISVLINNLLNWLYENVDKLSSEICEK